MASLLQTNPWRFAGGSFDSATSFTKFGVRYYDATTEKWTQQDPKAGSLFDPRSSNRYVYVKCDPVNVTDPGGKGDIVNCVLGVTLAIAGIGGGLAGIVAVVALTPEVAVGAILIGAYAGLAVGFFAYLGGLVAAFQTWYSGVCDFSS